jgi:uncharacterized membrane protein YeaQ/YmgE (transglycosylase-associated protein family)
MGFQQDGAFINSFIWCAVGAGLGWLSGRIGARGNHIVLLENLAVGIFGAFIGGDFVAAVLRADGVNDAVFSPRSPGLAVIGAVVMLLLLRLMRTLVGPLHHRKSVVRRRD